MADVWKLTRAGFPAAYPDGAGAMIRGIVNTRLEAVVATAGAGTWRGRVGRGRDRRFRFHCVTCTTVGDGACFGPRSAIGWWRLCWQTGRFASSTICAAEVQWDGNWRSVLVSAVGTEPLLGMRLLAFGGEYAAGQIVDALQSLPDLPPLEFRLGPSNTLTGEVNAFARS